jgi:DnaJ-class molecular chaperone
MTLDGRVLAIPCPEVVSPGYSKVLKGEGMPVEGEEGVGDLRLRFKIAFPRHLSEDKKVALRKLLD